MEAAQSSPMVGADRLARQVARYGKILSDALALDPDYQGEACSECAYDHTCCDLFVSITPYEALGIMSWLKVNDPDWTTTLGLVKMRASALQEFIFDKEGKPYFETPEKMLTAWWERKIKCPFYSSTARDGEGGCLIYPVRPVACRKAFSKGDCGGEKANGIDTMSEDPHLNAARLNRVRVRQLEALGGQKTGEMCALITMLRSPDALIISEDPAIMDAEPETLTDHQVLFGLAAQPMENQWCEE